MLHSHSREIFGLTLLNNNHPDIRRLKSKSKQAEFHGHKFWKSSLVLMDYLREYPLETSARVLEVGCGWGLASIFCAKNFNSKVVGLDADDHVFPFLEHHAELNGVNIDTVQMPLEDLTAEQLSGFDAVIGADICFWDELIAPVGEMIDRCYEACVPRVILTDPGRPGFRELAELCQQELPTIYSDWVVPEPHNQWGLVMDIRTDAE